MGAHMFISLITIYLSASGSNGPVDGTLEQWELVNPEDGGITCSGIPLLDPGNRVFLRLLV